MSVVDEIEWLEPGRLAAGVFETARIVELSVQGAYTHRLLMGSLVVVFGYPRAKWTPECYLVFNHWTQTGPYQNVFRSLDLAKPLALELAVAGVEAAMMRDSVRRLTGAGEAWMAVRRFR